MCLLRDAVKQRRSSAAGLLLENINYVALILTSKRSLAAFKTWKANTKLEREACKRESEWKMNRRAWMAFTDWLRTPHSARSTALYNKPEIGTDGILLTHAGSGLVLSAGDFARKRSGKADSLYTTKGSELCDPSVFFQSDIHNLRSLQNGQRVFRTQTRCDLIIIFDPAYPSRVWFSSHWDFPKVSLKVSSRCWQEMWRKAFGRKKKKNWRKYHFLFSIWMAELALQ